MHQSRAQVSKKVPIPRKGTKYVAKAFVNPQNSIPVLIAVRDMLKLARTKKEVKKMIQSKSLKINGKEVKDPRDSIQLFNNFTADKEYTLTLSTTGKFAFETCKKPNERVCKVVDKKILPGKKVQLNLHDGTNIIYDKKVSVHDSVVVSSSKISKHIPFEKGQNCFITSGKYKGHKATIEKIENGKAKVKIADKETSTSLDKSRIIVL